MAALPAPRTTAGPAASRSSLGRGVLVALSLVLVAATLVWVWPRTERAVEGGTLPVAGAPDDAAAVTNPADGPLALEVPWDGAVVIGTSLEVRGVANRPIGAVRAVVTSGTTVLGAADLSVDGPGPFRVNVPLAAIGTVGKAQLTIASNGARQHRVLASRDVTVCVLCF